MPRPLSEMRSSTCCTRSVNDTLTALAFAWRTIPRALKDAEQGGPVARSSADRRLFDRRWQRADAGSRLEGQCFPVHRFGEAKMVQRRGPQVGGDALHDGQADIAQADERLHAVDERRRQVIR